MGHTRLKLKVWAAEYPGRVIVIYLSQPLSEPALLGCGSLLPSSKPAVLHLSDHFSVVISPLFHNQEMLFILRTLMIRLGPFR